MTNYLFSLKFLIKSMLLHTAISFVLTTSFESNRHDKITKPLFALSADDVIGLDEKFISFPDSSYNGLDVVTACMEALCQNSQPIANAGLEVCWNFSSDRCRAAQGGSLEQFIEFAGNPIFSSLVNAQSWTIKSTGPIIPGTLTRGAMQTVLIEVSPQKGRMREFLWTVQCERRPPRQDCWLVHECIFKDNAWSQTL